MKKIYVMALSILTIFVLSACSFSEEKERVFLYEDIDGSYSIETFTYKGDKLLKQSGEHFTYYDWLDVNNDDEAKMLVEEFNAESPTFEAVTYEYEFNGNHLIEYIIIDTTKLTPESYEFLYGDTITKKELRYLSMEETAKNIEADGYVEITEE